jgi:hypothetical protein
MRATIFQLRLRTILACVAVIAYVLYFLAPFVQLPSRERTNAIQAATKAYIAIIGRPPTFTRATRLQDGRWRIALTEVVNSEPGGLRETRYFEVDAHQKCRYIGLVEGGSY